MANHASHAALPFPVKNARFTIGVGYLNSSGVPTDPTTPDTEISKDGGTFADTAEEVTTVAGSNGSGYITLSGAEMDCSIAQLAAKVASGPNNSLIPDIRPRVLPVLHSGTAQAGAAGTITLTSGAPAYDLSGCIVKTTGGTGGGGTGGANNQARVITAYNPSTKVATVVPNWETNPSSDTTYEVLITEMAVNALIANVVSWAGAAVAAVNVAGVPKVDLTHIVGNTGGPTQLDRSARSIVRGTATTGGTTTSIPTSSLDPAASVTDQFKGRVVVFDKDTTTAALRGQATDITTSSSGGVLTVTLMTTAPASGDTFVII